MKLKQMIGCAIAITMGLGSIAAIASSDYYPPERLHCRVDNAGKLTCSDFNRKYLVEDTYTADFPAGKEIIFTFATGAAYSTPQNEWAVFYTFKDTHSKMVKLRTTNTDIQPSLKNGAWKKNKDLYTCSAGYMSCGITNLPA